MMQLVSKRKQRDHTPAPANAHGHVPALDGVRGIAILLVMLYHLAISFALISRTPRPLLLPFRFGWCGVSIFFTLSGFLITGILLDTRSSAHYFKSFYARRALRILPLYYVGILVVFLLETALPNAGVWGARGGVWSSASLMWPSLYVENLALLRGGGAGVIAHYWSLAVEEHFYLVWPLLIWLVRTRRQVLTLAALASILSVAGRAALWLHGVDINRVFSLTPFQLDGLAIGACAAVVVRSGHLDKIMRWTAALSTVPVGLLFALVFLRHSLDQSDPGLWIFSYPLISLSTALVLILSLGRGAIAAVLSIRVLRWFGKYSFGLYVWHPIVGTLLFHSRFSLVSLGASNARVLSATAAILLVDLLVAWLSFHLFEKRFLALKRYFLPNTRVEPVPETVMDEAMIHTAPSPAL